jgi:hypothetical protein
MDVLDQIFFCALYLIFFVNLPIAAIATLLVSVFECFKVASLDQPLDGNAVLLILKDKAPQAFINWFLWPRQLYRLAMRKT